MNLSILINELEILANAPNGMNLLRTLILDLALSGKLSQEKIVFEQKLLGDISVIRTGKLDANASSEDGIYPFFTCAKDPLRITTYTYDTECVLLAGNGNFDVNYYSGKFDAYQRTYILEAKNKDELFVPFLYRFMQSHARKLTEQSIGGVIKYLKIGFLTSAPIRIPSFENQKSIVAVIDSLMSLCDEIELRTNHQESIRTSARSSAIDAISTAQTSEGLQIAWERIQQNWEVIAGTRESITSLRKLLVDLAIQGQLFGRRPIGSHGYPAAWEVNDFRSVGNIEGGNQPPKSAFSSEPREGYVQLFQIRDLGPNPVPVYIPKKLARSTSIEGEILIGRYGASVGKIFRAKTGAYNVALVKFIYPKEKLDSEFVYWFLKSSRSQSLFTGMSRSAQAGFNKRDLATLLIPIPTRNEQQEILERLNALMEICGQLERAFLKASELAGKFARSVSSFSV